MAHRVELAGVELVGFGLKRARTRRVPSLASLLAYIIGKGMGITPPGT